MNRDAEERFGMRVNDVALKMAVSAGPLASWHRSLSKNSLRGVTGLSRSGLSAILFR